MSGSFRMMGSQDDDQTNLRVRRTPPLYPHAIWYVHDATLTDSHRTNNVCEGWNNKFFSMVGNHHPSIWKVIMWFQREESTVQTILQQDAVVNPPRKCVNKGLAHLPKRLKTLCEDRIQGSKSIPVFLGVGHIRVNKRH